MAEIKIIGQMDNTQDHTFESANRVYSPEGIAPTIPTCGGGGIQPKICEIKALDEQNISIHDDGTVGTLTTDGSSPKHNNRVMEIQKVGNVVGKGESQGGNTYLADGISPSLLAGMSHGNVMPFIVDEKPLNTMEDGTCRTIKSQYHFTTTQNLDSQGTFGATGAVSIVAMRGRDTTNPNHRGRANENYEQRLEERTDGCTNTITTVQKDNLLLIKQATKEGYIPCKIGGVANLEYPNSATRRGRVIENGEISPTLTTESIPSVLEKWIWEIDGIKYLIRIRKLTPKECWRLMGFTDTDFEKAEKVNSNTQLYKQAGNSIVKDVLMNVFLQLVKGDK